jgi:hypothetical protein
MITLSIASVKERTHGLNEIISFLVCKKLQITAPVFFLGDSENKETYLALVRDICWLACCITGQMKYHYIILVLSAVRV